MEPILKLSDVRVEFKLPEGQLVAVDGINFTLHKGEILGIVGESGCGKSVMSKAILNIVPRPGRVSGDIQLLERDGNRLGRPVNIAAMKPNSREIRGSRGNDIAMIFQEPMAAFSPVHTIGQQIMEALLLHRTRDKKEARQIAISMIRKVGIANPEQRIDEYVHQLSGGMRQRAMIAMALSCNPSILIADEPTTALDVTIQAQVLDLMKELQRETGMAILYITHDLGVIAEICDAVAVMYLGQIMEKADTDTLFHHPLHPYTRALLASIPRVDDKTRARLFTIDGSVPVPIDLPDRCPFYDRCRAVNPEMCGKGRPPLIEVEPGHFVRCHLVKGGA